jgi:hypothetical protein
MKRDHLEDLGVDGIMILKLLRKEDMRMWIALIWLRAGCSGGIL